MRCWRIHRYLLCFGTKIYQVDDCLIFVCIPLVFFDRHIEISRRYFVQSLPSWSFLGGSASPNVPLGQAFVLYLSKAIALAGCAVVLNIVRHEMHSLTVPLCYTSVCFGGLSGIDAGPQFLIVQLDPRWLLKRYSMEKQLPHKLPIGLCPLARTLRLSSLLL